MRGACLAIGCAVGFVVIAAAGAAAQAVEVHGDHFRVSLGDGLGSQDRFLIFVSYFDGMRASDATLDRDFAYISQTLHLDGVRVFPNWWDNTCSQGHCYGPDTLMSTGAALRAGALDRLRHVIDKARQYKLLVDVTFARDPVCDDRPAPVAGACRAPLTVANYRTQIAAALSGLASDGRFGQIIVDLQNERDLDDAKHPNHFLSTKDVHELVRQVSSSWIVMASNTETSGEAATAAMVTDPSGPLDVAAYHDPRVSNWASQTTAVVNNLRSHLRHAADPPPPVYLQEPQRWQADPKPEDFTAAVKNARNAGAAAWTFHTTSGYLLSGSQSFRTNVENDAPQESALRALRKAAPSARDATWPITR